MNFKMRPSRVLRKLRNGETVNSFKCNFKDARLTEIAAAHGFDCIWVCREHVPNDLSVLETQIMSAKLHDTDLVCRVPRGSYSDYIKPLELDATGVMVPHIMNAEDAENVVNMLRFPPLGRRPVDGGNSDGFYCGIKFAEYLEQANKERFIILQIEDPEAVEDIENIAAVEGFDMLFYGPGDYSVSIGVPGQLEHPEVRRVRKLVADTARKYGKFAGTVGSPENRNELIETGYQFINVSGSVKLFMRGIKAEVAALGIKTERKVFEYSNE